MISSIRRAARVLRRTPISTGVTVLSLSLGIGANAAIFSVFSQLVLRPLSVVEAHRLVNLGAPGPKPGFATCNAAGGCENVFSYPMFRDLQRQQTVFADLAAHRAFGGSVGYRGRTTMAQGMAISGSYFSTLGILPAAGRLFGSEVDEGIGQHPVVVLSYEFWVSEFGGSREVIGKPVVVNGRTLTVVGVTGAGFRGTTVTMPAKIFVPITMAGALSVIDDNHFGDRRSYWIYLFARLRTGVSVEQARSAMAPVYASILREVEAPLQRDLNGRGMAGFESKPLVIADGRRGQNGMVAMVGGALFIMFVLTGMVVLIACANVANLWLASWATRAREFALRTAIGASRQRLVADMVAESCVLALMGGLGGLIAAQATVRFMVALLPADVANVLRLEFDVSTLPFTGMVALAIGLLGGLVPALQKTRGNLIGPLREAGPSATGLADRRLGSGLVMLELALAMALVATSGLFVDNLRHLERADAGVPGDTVLTFRLWPTMNGYGQEEIRSLYHRLSQVLRGQPGVTGVTVASGPLFANGMHVVEVVVEGFDAEGGGDRNAGMYQVGTDYFRTLGIRILSGRGFENWDGAEAPRVAVVNQAFVRKFGSGGEVVGKRLGRGGGSIELDTIIVGVAADIRHDVRRPAAPMLYVSYRQEEWVGNYSVYVSSEGAMDALLRSVPGLVAGIDGALPVTFLKTLRQEVVDNIFRERAIGTLAGATAGLAMLLAALGLYGVVNYWAIRRAREFGVRMAVGADRKAILMMVLGQAAGMVAGGLSVGILVTWWVGGAANALLYEGEGLEGKIVLLAAMGLTFVALVAGVVPAYRASMSDPMVALRED